MKHSRWSVLLAFVVCATTARAQTPGAAYCDAPTVFNNDATLDGGLIKRMHPRVARSRYVDAVEREDWVTALRLARADALQAFDEGKVTADHRTKFSTEIDSVLAALDALPGKGDPGRATYIANRVRPARFGPQQRATGYELFGFATAIDLAGATDDQLRALCWSAHTIDGILFRLTQSLDAEALARLSRIGRAWSNYRTYGYTRQPLELMLWRGRTSDTVPPKGQYILGHLSAGAELRGSSADSLAGDATVVIEAGAIRYWRNYTQYYGASAIASVASGKTVGAGVLLHVARGVRAGVVWRNDGVRTRRSIVVSTDLYGMLERSKKAVDDGLAMAKGRVLLPSRAGK